MLITQISIWDESESDVIATITRDDNGDWILEVKEKLLSSVDVEKISKAYIILDDYVDEDGEIKFVGKGLMI
jgi:hypothetical protein